MLAASATVHLCSAFPQTTLRLQKNTIHGAIWDLATRFPTEITKPSRGLFLPADASVDPAVVMPPILPVQKLSEQVFYEAFADWLKNDLDEATC
jgi:hypothetical protein